MKKYLVKFSYISMSSTSNYNAIVIAATLGNVLPLLAETDLFNYGASTYSIDEIGDSAIDVAGVIYFEKEQNT